MKLLDFSRLLADEDGQSLVETGLVYLFVTIAVIISLVTFGDSLLAQFSDSASKISEATN